MLWPYIPNFHYYSSRNRSWYKEGCERAHYILSVCGGLLDQSIIMKERNVLFKDALNTFYL